MNRVAAVVCATLLSIAGLGFAAYLLTHGTNEGTVTVVLVGTLAPTVTALLALGKASDAQHSANDAQSTLARFAELHGQLHQQQNQTIDTLAHVAVNNTTDTG